MEQKTQADLPGQPAVRKAAALQAGTVAQREQEKEAPAVAGAAGIEDEEGSYHDPDHAPAQQKRSPAVDGGTSEPASHGLWEDEMAKLLAFGAW